MKTKQAIQIVVAGIMCLAILACAGWGKTKNPEKSLRKKLSEISMGQETVIPEKPGDGVRQLVQMEFEEASSENGGATPLQYIYVVPLLGHLDYGFTATQREVREKWPDIYRAGIRFLEKNPHGKLVSGSLLPLEWFHETATASEWKRFSDLVASGRWEITAGLMHANTSVFSEAETSRFFLDSRKWSESLGVPIDIWHHADVPGLTWNMCESATDAGIKFIAVGANEMGGLSPLSPRLPRLFFWEAPDGTKTLVSLHGGSGYMQGSLDLALHEPDGLRERIEQYVDDLKARGYELDISMVLYSTGDNNGPEILQKLVESIEKWNSVNGPPFLRLATFEDFYADLHDEKDPRRRALLKKLPLIRGDWPASGTWESLVRRCPHAEAAAHEAKRKIVTAQLLSVILGDRNSADWIRRTWRDILLYDEHSGAGAWPGKMTEEQVVEQNKTETSMAINALDDVEDYILDAANSRYMSKFLRVSGRPLLLCNTENVERGGLVEWSREIRAYNRRRVAAYRTGIPGWSCRVGSVRQLEDLPPSSGELAVQLKGPAWFEPPLFLDLPKPMKAYRAKDVAIGTSFYRVDKDTSYVRLNFAAAARMPETQNARGLSVAFDLGRAYKFVSMMRGGLEIATDLFLGTSPVWEIARGPITLKTEEGTIDTVSLENAPFYAPNGENDMMMWLLYSQETAVEMKDSEKALVYNEPSHKDASSQVSWLVRRNSGDRDVGKKLCPPLDGYMYMEAIAIEAGDGVMDQKDFKTFSLSTPEVVIEDIAWSEFGPGVMVRVRNTSAVRLTANILSHLGDITGAYLADGLQRNIRELEHGKGWIKIELAPREVINVRVLRE